MPDDRCFGLEPQLGYGNGSLISDIKKIPVGGGISPACSKESRIVLMVLAAFRRFLGLRVPSMAAS
jgi:hypothetical protein